MADNQRIWNRAFYNQQLAKQLRQDDSWKAESDNAEWKAKVAAQTPSAAPAVDWSWANGGKGLPTVQVTGRPGQPASTGGGAAGNVNVATPSPYSLNSWITPGKTTDAEISRHAVDAGLVKPDKGWPIPYEQFGATDWSMGTDPNALAKGYITPQTSEGWASKVKAAMNSMFTQQGVGTPAGGGPTAPPGYASPRGA